MVARRADEVEVVAVAAGEVAVVEAGDEVVVVDAVEDSKLVGEGAEGRNNKHATGILKRIGLC